MYGLIAVMSESARAAIVAIRFFSFFVVSIPLSPQKRQAQLNFDKWFVGLYDDGLRRAEQYSYIKISS